MKRKNLLEKCFELWEKEFSSVPQMDTYVLKNIKYMSMKREESQLSEYDNYYLFFPKAYPQYREQLFLKYYLGPSFTDRGYKLKVGMGITADNLALAKDNNEEIMKAWLYAYIYDAITTARYYSIVIGPKTDQLVLDLLDLLKKEDKLSKYGWPIHDVCEYRVSDYSINPKTNKTEYRPLNTLEKFIKKAADDYKKFINEYEIIVVKGVCYSDDYESVYFSDSRFVKTK